MAIIHFKKEDTYGSYLHNNNPVKKGDIILFDM